MGKRFSKHDKIFIGIIILVHVAFFLLALHYTRIYMGDSYEYIYEALNIKDSFFFYSGNPVLPISPEYMTQRQPGYPLLLTAVYFFTVNNWVVVVLQNLLSIFNIYYCRKVFMRLGFNTKYDWLLLLLVIGYPSQFINANTIAPDVVLQTCTVLYFSHFVQLWHNKNIKHAALMSVWLVAGLMVKPVLYPFTLVHFIFLLVLFVYWKLKLQRMVVVALIPIVAVLLYNYINYSRTGKFHFSSNQAFNAIYYYYPFLSATQGMDSANKFLQQERATINAIPNYKDRYDYANEQGISMLKGNLVPYLAFHFKNSARIFVDPGKAEMDLFTGKLTFGKLYSKKQAGFFATWKNSGFGGMAWYFKENNSMPFVILVLLLNSLRAFGMVLFFLNRRVNGMVRLFTFMLIGYFAFAAGPIANTRYFIPVSLVAIGCAVLGYTSYLAALQKRKTLNVADAKGS